MKINSNPNQWYSDLQNGFWQDNAELQPKTASLTGNQVRDAFSNLFCKKANDPDYSILLELSFYAAPHQIAEPLQEFLQVW